jgi:hypothetical protein
MAIENIKIRATISIGGFSVSTPYILSFNVTKQRGTPSTFDASIKVHSSALGNISGDVVISAGGNGVQKKIFTGILKQMKPSPCWDDPSYVVLNISGTDVLSKLENKRFTRRQIYSDNSWAIITSAQPGLRSGNAKFTNVPIVIAGGGGISSSTSSEAKANNDNGIPISPAKYNNKPDSIMINVSFV